VKENGGGSSCGEGDAAVATAEGGARDSWAGRGESNRKSNKKGGRWLPLRKKKIRFFRVRFFLGFCNDPAF
jgi:hypothetical protein